MQILVQSNHMDAFFLSHSKLHEIPIRNVPCIHTVVASSSVVDRTLVAAHHSPEGGRTLLFYKTENPQRVRLKFKKYFHIFVFKKIPRGYPRVKKQLVCTKEHETMLRSLIGSGNGGSSLFLLYFVCSNLLEFGYHLTRANSHAVFICLFCLHCFFFCVLFYLFLVLRFSEIFCFP